jgi:hypothetical protein
MLPPVHIIVHIVYTVQLRSQICVMSSDDDDLVLCRIYTLRKVRATRGCLEGLALMM